MRSVDFDRINGAALAALESILARWLPDGTKHGREFTARNPKRVDRHAGSFRINVDTGKWADFVPGGGAGGDPISLAAYLFDLSQLEAAQRVAEMLRIDPWRSDNGR